MILRLNFNCCFSFLWPYPWINFLWVNLLLFSFLSVVWSSGLLLHYILEEGLIACLIALSYPPIATFLFHPMSSSSDQVRKPDGNSLSHDPDSNPNCSSQLANSGSMARGRPSNPHNQNPSSTGSFSDALRFGVESHHSSLPSPIHLQSVNHLQ